MSLQHDWVLVVHTECDDLGVLRRMPDIVQALEDRALVFDTRHQLCGTGVQIFPRAEGKWMFEVRVYAYQAGSDADGVRSRKSLLETHRDTFHRTLAPLLKQCRTSIEAR